MLTLVDLGHKPRSSCYLIEIDLYQHSEHKPIYILIDTPIEQSDLLDFIPNNVPNGFYFHNTVKQQYQNKTNWKLDESGKQWIIGNKRFKNSPFYATVPFDNVNIKRNKHYDRKKNNTNLNSRKRQFPFNDDKNEQKDQQSQHQPNLINKDKIFIDIILISNHQSIAGLPHLFWKKDQKMKNNLLDSLLSTDPITINDIMSDKDMFDSNNDHNNSNNNNNKIEIFMSGHCEIYATEATKYYGKLLLKSLCVSCDDEYFTLNNIQKNKEEEEEYINKCINNIKKVEFNESLDILNNELSIICISSGLYIGSSNWIIKGNGLFDIKLGIVMGSCGATNRHPKSITLSPYFHQIDNIDIMLIDDLQSIQLNDESVSESLSNMDKKIHETITNKGTVIIPTLSIGIAYDILEQAYQSLNKYDQYGQTKIYFISSIANESISYSSIYGEYLHKKYMKQVSDGKYPFGFHSFIYGNKKRIIYSKNINNLFCFKHFSLKEPKIIICDSPSLRYGNILHLLNIFNDRKNTLILTDPTFTPHLALYPFQNDTATTNDDIDIHNNNFDLLQLNQLKLQIVSYAIDARLQIKELCVLLRKVAPKYAFIPNSYYKRILQNMNKFININATQINKHSPQSHQQQQNKPNPNIMSPILLQKIKDIKYCTMSNGSYQCINLKQEQKIKKKNETNTFAVIRKKKKNKPDSKEKEKQKQKMTKNIEEKKEQKEKDETETFYFTKAFNTGDMKTLYIDPLISQNIYPKKINPNHSDNMFIASLSGNIDYNTNKNKLILTNKPFINEKCVINKTFIGTLNVNGFINNLKQNESQYGFTNIQQTTNRNVISFNINKNQKIKVLTNENVTNIRSDTCLKKQTLAVILDLVSKQLVSF